MFGPKQKEHSVVVVFCEMCCTKSRCWGSAACVCVGFSSNQL